VVKVRNVFLSVIAVAAVAVAQDTFSPLRTYVVGEKDVYSMSMKMESEQYDVTMTGKMSYLVKKLYDNGDADLETKVYNVVMNAMGQEVQQPESPAQVRRYNKYGVPIEKVDPKAPKQPTFMNFLAYRNGATLKLGESMPIQEELNDEAKTKVKGKAKLDSISDGVAKVVTQLDITSKNSSKPMHVESISYLDTKSSKLNRVESKVTNVEQSATPGLPGLKSITVVLQRDKS